MYSNVIRYILDGVSCQVKYGISPPSLKKRKHKTGRSSTLEGASLKRQRALRLENRSACAQDEVLVGSSWEFSPRCQEADWEKLGHLRGSTQWKAFRSLGICPPRTPGSGHSQEILLLSCEFLVDDIISSFFCCHHHTTIDHEVLTKIDLMLVPGPYSIKL